MNKVIRLIQNIVCPQGVYAYYCLLLITINSIFLCILCILHKDWLNSLDVL